MNERFLTNDDDVEIVSSPDGPPLTLFDEDGRPIPSEFRGRDIFVVLTCAVRSVHGDDVEASGAIARTMQRLADEHHVDVGEVRAAIRQVNGSVDEEE